nr:hypothetical protein [Tanacetum cinerariifolium]
MAPLTFVDTHNMIVFLTKSDKSEGFDQIVDFLNAHTIQYALMVNPPIYVSCIKPFWASVSLKKTNDVVKLQAPFDRKKVDITEDTIRQAFRLDDADGVECLPNEEIFLELAQKKRRSKSFGLKRLWKVGTSQRVVSSNDIVVDAQEDASKHGGIAELDAKEDVTLPDVDTAIEMDADIQGRIEEDVTAVMEVNAAEPIVFDDEEVTITMA